MRQLLVLLMGLVTLFTGVAQAKAGSILPVAEFTVRDDDPRDGVPDKMDTETGPFGIYPSITNYNWADETFCEFPLGASTVPAAGVSFTIWNATSSAQYGESKDFQASYYSGTGIPDISRFGTGTYLSTITHPTSAKDVTFSFDVTSEYNSLVTLGASHIGFRLHDPVWTSDPSVGHQLYYLGSQLTVVPEPSTLVLLSIGTLALTIGWWRRRRAA